MASEWKTGLCSCCAEPGGVQVCCLAFCCPGVIYGLNIENLSRPHHCPLGGSCMGAGVVWSGLAYSGLCCIAQCMGRAGIRKKYNIQGGVFVDCLFSTFCGCCALIQVLFKNRLEIVSADPFVGAGVQPGSFRRSICS